MTESSEYASTDDDDYSDLAQLQQRTWIAAAPYLGAAALSWVGAAFAEYQLTDVIGQGQLPSALKRTVFQVLASALLYAGLGLFTVGLLVVAFRQHERWRRDCGRWLGDPLDEDFSDAELLDGPVEREQ